MHITLEDINNNNKNEYIQYINSRGDTSFVDLWEWRELVEKIYNLSHYWYIAKEDGKVTGSLCLTFAQHNIFGKYLVTAPFANQGGFYAETDNAFKSLLHKTTELVYSLKAQYALIRHLNGSLNPPSGWKQDSSYATYYIKLTSEPAIYLRNQIGSKKRNQIMKSISNGLSIKYGRLDLLNDFWYIMSCSMKELGSPYHSKYYLETLLRIMGNKSELAVVYTKDLQPAGGSLIIYHANKATLLHANTLKNYRYLCVGDFLYWSVIADCCMKGFNWLDMGRSLIGSGNDLFKMKWNPIKQPLGYWYKMSTNRELPSLNQASPKLQIAINIWRRMPLWLLRPVGPHLISGLL